MSNKYYKASSKDEQYNNCVGVTEIGLLCDISTNETDMAQTEKISRS